MAEGVVRLPGHPMRLIAAKLEPPRTPTKFVSRDRLHSKLDRAASRQLTLVSGPAGSGKSSLLASWINKRSLLGTDAWLTIDDFDNDPARLWAYLLAALRRCAAGDQLAGPTGQSLLSHGVDADFISEVAGALGGLSVPLVLVLDNVDRLGEGPAADSIASLLRYGLPMFHLVLGSRSEPPLPLARLHVAGELTRIEPEELAFTAAEAAQLWALRSLPLPDDEARALVAQTEGWAAGLCLLAQGDPIESCAEFLRGEVMAGLDVPTREFLLRTSVAGTLTAELADALTGHSHGAPMLESLRRQSLAVHVTHAEPGRFRYRSPFLGFLRDQARLEIPDELPQLHLRAAGWYVGHGEPIRAVEHAVAAADWRRAASIAVTHAPAELFGPERETLLALIDRLPVPGAAQQPEIAAALALAAADRGDCHDAEGFLVLARHSGGRLATLRQHPLRVALRLAELMLARHRQDWPAVHAAAGELRLSLDNAMPCAAPASAALRAVCQEHLGQAWLWEAKPARAVECLQAALTGAREHRLELVEVSALGALALIEALAGHLHEAARLANAAVRLLEPAGRLRSKHAMLSLLALAVIQWLRGHPLKAGQRLAAAHAADRHEPSRAGSAAHAAIRAMVLLSQREVAAARQAVAESNVDGNDRPPPFVRDLLTLAEAEIQVRQGHCADAIALLNASPPPAHPLDARATVVAAQAHLADGAAAHAISLLARLHRRQLELGPWARVEAWLVHALAAERLGHDGAVRIALTEALSAAATEDLFAPFLSAGMPLAALLSGHRDLLAAQAGFGQRLSDLLPPPAEGEHEDPAGLEPITEREAVVLRYLPSLLTTKDIADELSVSPNTVKSHLRSLYRKLAVGTRRQAVQHARKLGLLRPDDPGVPPRRSREGSSKRP